MYKFQVFVFSVLSLASFINSDKGFSFGNHNHGIVAAFGDFNSDELTDTFIITNKTNLQVYIAYDKEPFLRPSSYACNFSEFRITGVMPGDYDGDAYMDILLTTISRNSSDMLQEIRIIWGGKPTLNCTDASIIKVYSVDQPLVLDYNHDMILDLFGLNNQNQRVFWIFNELRSQPKELLMGSGFYKELKIPHSHAYLDFDGDNAADLLITTKFDIEVWLSGADGFYNSYNIQLPIGHENATYGQVNFLDVSLTGQFYLVLPVCYDLLCMNSTIWIYDNKVWHDLRIDLNDEKGTIWRFVPPHDELYLDTITMRSGDFNMDGYPDILVALCPENSNEPKTFLLHNIPCNLPECEFHRTFQVKWTTLDSFGKNVVMATFFDFYMDGVLDIIYVQKNETTQAYTMHAFKNELDYDTNFIKVMVVTGLTNANSPPPVGPLNRGQVTFGTNLPGPRISYNTWSQEGNYRTGVCAQLSQSAYFSLQLPYSIFGLDRTPNFVDNLNVGIAGYLRTWTQIIPNSQIVVIPSPPTDPSQWRAQLFVTPSKFIVKSVLVLLSLILIIAMCVLFLHWKERNDRQDIIEIDEKTYVKI